MTLATLLLVTLVTAQAPATPRTPEAPAESSTVSAPPLVGTPEACSASAESDYTAGFDALVEGRDREALESFERVLSACPQHPYATELLRLARTRLIPGGRLAAAAASERGPEGRSDSGLAAMTVVQTLHGAAQGILLCAIAECSAQGVAAASVLGAGAGAATVLLLAKGSGVTSGQAAAINSGTVWGFWFGIASLLAFDLGGDDAIGTVMLGGAGFTGVGILLALTARPTAGQVSMANSGALWTGVVTALLLATSDSDDTETFFAVELGATAAGLVVLGALSTTFEVSRGRMLIIDAGGIIGGLLGAASTFVLAGENAGDEILVGTAAGVVGGLALTAYLTRDFDTPDAPQAVLTPTLLGRDGMGLAVVGRF
ncbi:hypothetical protein HPC49_22160 [Pyxidicoccus fallax]|uniref:Uncharacterized protein n=1 Tax=Pyxidicoccus fallax TaxID=394095 RepID=A0A848LIZ6_9BACT|nr:hypothetical protein [Pyxidicoccus fallax]NMO17692.1 hypothetical protein [Pyxidicoccus fallax]NPC80917.1 hypothetical protein [Pyxidicoccus fallax]